jgi:hypothetical protein
LVDGVPWVKSTNPYAERGWRRNTLHDDTAAARRAGQQILLDLGLVRPPDEQPGEGPPPDTS